jgi:hypothetical protein
LLCLQESDASTKFFHAHANIKRRRNHIHSLVVDGNAVHLEEAMAQAVHSYFDTMLGTPPPLQDQMESIFVSYTCLEWIQLA